jgi:hypothetical protein
LSECARRFAQDLETVLRRDPLQWYNFYPFWETDQTQPEPRTNGSLDPIPAQAARLPTRS